MGDVSSEVFQMHTMSRHRPCNVVRAVNDGDVTSKGGDDVRRAVLNTDSLRTTHQDSSCSNRLMTGVRRIPGGRFVLWRPRKLLRMDCNGFSNL